MAYLLICKSMSAGKLIRIEYATNIHMLMVWGYFIWSPCFDPYIANNYMREGTGTRRWHSEHYCHLESIGDTNFDSKWDSRDWHMWKLYYRIWENNVILGYIINKNNLVVY